MIFSTLYFYKMQTVFQYGFDYMQATPLKVGQGNRETVYLCEEDTLDRLPLDTKALL